jgi:hypothetical protein
MPNGIFSNDAALIAQHVVQLITLTPTQIRAADVSGLHSISSFDAALIAQYVVGIPNPLNQSGKWKFTPMSTMPDTTVDSTQNYLALLLGDVSGDWLPPTMARPVEAIVPDPATSVRVSIPDTKAARGQ